MNDDRIHRYTQVKDTKITCVQWQREYTGLWHTWKPGCCCDPGKVPYFSLEIFRIVICHIMAAAKWSHDRHKNLEFSVICVYKN